MTIIRCYFTLNIPKNAGYMKIFVIIYACSLFGCFENKWFKSRKENDHVRNKRKNNGTVLQTQP